MIRKGDEVVFRTKAGNLWLPKGSGNPITLQFLRLCRGTGLYKAGRGFYSLRATCKTVGEESGDFPAIEYIMGHAPNLATDMAAVYREPHGTQETLPRGEVHQTLVGLEQDGTGCNVTLAALMLLHCGRAA